MSRPRPMVIDTDPGVDDAMAILYAIAEPGIELLGLTSVFGNLAEPLAAANALRLIELAGAEIPVARGADRPLVQAPVGDATHVHGAGGFGAAALPEPKRTADRRMAADFLAETCAARPGEVALVAIGPLTNLATALERHPQIAETAGRVVAMGGALRRRGNVTTVAEANIWQDPHAAARVFAAPWEVTLVPLDLTERVILSPADLLPMADVSPRCGAFLAEAAAFYFEFHRRSAGIEGCHLHDPVAVLAAVEAALFAIHRAPVAVTLDGAEAGRTRECGEGPAIALCLDGELDAIHARIAGGLASGRLP